MYRSGSVIGIRIFRVVAIGAVQLPGKSSSVVGRENIASTSQRGFLDSGNKTSE